VQWKRYFGSQVVSLGTCRLPKKKHVSQPPTAIAQRCGAARNRQNLAVVRTFFAVFLNFAFGAKSILFSLDDRLELRGSSHARVPVQLLRQTETCSLSEQSHPHKPRSDGDVI
jgi:hypothetical protein